MNSATFTCLFLSSSIAFGTVFLNEIRIDQPGGDDDEYVELFSDDPGNDTLAGLSLIVIGDGAGASGVIENVTDFSAVAAPFASDPYFLVAEASFSIGVADFTTTLGFENSDNVTYLLVDGFTGMGGDDLDTDDDGVLDTTPWASLADVIGLNEDPGGIPDGDGEFGYGDALGTSIGPDGTFVPGHVYRVGDAPGDWAIGEFDPATGVDTPGAANVVPEPSSALLVFFGLVGLANRRRR